MITDIQKEIDRLKKITDTCILAKQRYRMRGTVYGGNSKNAFAVQTRYTCKPAGGLSYGGTV